MVQWLRLHAPNAGNLGSLVRELDLHNATNGLPAVTKDLAYCSEDEDPTYCN